MPQTRPNPGTSPRSVSLPLASRWERALMVTERLPQGHRQENKCAQGRIVIKGCPKTSNQTAHKSLPTGRLAGTQWAPLMAGGSVRRTGGGRPYLEAWAHFGKRPRRTRMKSQETCHLRRPREVRMFRLEKPHRDVGSPSIPEGPLSGRRS